MKVFFFPIIRITLFFCIGIIIYTYTPILLKSILILLITFFILYVFFKYKKNKICVTLSLLFIWSAIGLLTCYIHNDLNYTNHYTNYNKSNEKKDVILVVTEKLKSSTKYNKYIARIKQINNEQCFGKIILYVDRTDNQHIQISSVLLSHTLISPIYEAKNPYQFSYKEYLENQNIFNQIIIKPKDYKIIDTYHNLDYYVNKIRISLINSYNIHKFPVHTQQFINAFLLGQRQDLDKNITEQYTQAGVVHILAISGLHISILYGILLLAFKALKFGPSQRYIQLFISLLFLWSFALITGMSASVIRCVTMFSIIAITMCIQKGNNIYNAMAISLLIILLINPKLLFDVGFQLSYSSVLIIIISNPLIKKLHFTKYKIVHYCIDLIAISVLVQLFLLPILLYYFNQIPLLFLLSNIIVIPLSSLILYLLVLVLPLNYIAPWLSVPIGKIIGILIKYMNLYVEWISQIKGASIENIPYNNILFISSYLLIISIFLILFKLNYRRIQILLYTIIITSIAFIYSYEKQNTYQKFIVWNLYKQTLITNQTSEEIKIYTSTPTDIEFVIQAMQQQYFNKNISINKIENYFINHSNKIALINSDKYYNEAPNCDYLILSQSPKINLERVIDVYKPKYIISDGSNYKSYSERWEKTCKTKKIPFYNTYKMGYYTISN